MLCNPAQFVEEAKSELVDDGALVEHQGPFFGLSEKIKDLFQMHRYASFTVY